VQNGTPFSSSLFRRGWNWLGIWSWCLSVLLYFDFHNNANWQTDRLSVLLYFDFMKELVEHLKEPFSSSLFRLLFLFVNLLPFLYFQFFFISTTLQHYPIIAETSFSSSLFLLNKINSPAFIVRLSVLLYFDLIRVKQNDSWRYFQFFFISTRYWKKKK